ncbi:uncharacterized protein AB675_4907 [Cyphellophora attinorum]|uniref:Uncharacterized protein n=1 Tax=Cyphellophora attinorum TaxID=1664694 RepID=A0A0N1GWN4_9EURO|nr:uncharacterized protein AB675_4907 [Phialophora attinorum]KPI34364.1 hypothetical protein AB675_4907 [Phialophora attinorum]
MSSVASERVKSLHDHFGKPNAPMRPILTFINGDVSWLISLPRPAAERASGPKKAYYHVAIDPWFGEQSAVGLTGLLLRMDLGAPAAISSRVELDAAVVDIEAAAGHVLVPTDAAPAVDAIALTIVTADHTDKPSLLEFAPRTPVFAVGAAARSVQGYGHFNTVVQIAGGFDPSTAPWKEASHPGAPLPDWLTIFAPAVTHLNNFGLVIITSADPKRPEAILNAPHGIAASERSIQALAALEPPAVILALIAPVKQAFFFNKLTVFGAEQAVRIADETKARYWLRTGDLVNLKYGGLIGYWLSDVHHDVEWGRQQLRKDFGERVFQTAEPLAVPNGGTLVLA